MLRIRRIEERCIAFAETGEIRAHYHLYIGQEAAGTGASAALAPDDYVFTTHRNHGHVIAKGGDLGRVLAEIIGRSDGYLGGRPGAFPRPPPQPRPPPTPAIVGGTLPHPPRGPFPRRRPKGPAAAPRFLRGGPTGGGGLL